MDEKFLQDWGEYIVGLSTFLFGALITIWVYKRQTKQKELSYNLRSSNLLRYSNSVKDDIEVTYKGEVVKNLTAVEISFQNTGEVPILHSDFEEDIVILLEEKEVIFSADIKETSPLNLSAEIVKKSPHGLSIQCGLLNPKDKFLILMLIDSATIPKIDIYSRIAGIGKIKEGIHFVEKPGYQKFLNYLGVGYTLASVLGFVLVTYKKYPNIQTIGVYLLYISTFMGIVIMYSTIMTIRRRTKGVW